MGFASYFSSSLLLPERHLQLVDLMVNFMSENGSYFGSFSVPIIDKELRNQAVTFYSVDLEIHNSDTE